jgi:hypothetical protein
METQIDNCHLASALLEPRRIPTVHMPRSSFREKIRHPEHDLGAGRYVVSVVYDTVAPSNGWRLVSTAKRSLFFCIGAVAPGRFRAREFRYASDGSWDGAAGDEVEDMIICG